MFRSVAVVALLGLVLAGCSGDPEPPAPAPAPVSSSSAPVVDPYEVYLAHAPQGEPPLSRQDASTRALLGCGTKWPPGTVDAVLADAYAELCK